LCFEAIFSSSDAGHCNFQKRLRLWSPYDESWSPKGLIDEYQWNASWVRSSSESARNTLLHYLIAKWRDGLAS
jgi:hypothetical protein